MKQQHQNKTLHHLLRLPASHSARHRRRHDTIAKWVRMQSGVLFNRCGYWCLKRHRRMSSSALLEYTLPLPLIPHPTNQLSMIAKGNQKRAISTDRGIFYLYLPYYLAVVINRVTFAKSVPSFRNRGAIAKAEAYIQCRYMSTGIFCTANRGFKELMTHLCEYFLRQGLCKKHSSSSTPIRPTPTNRRSGTV